MQLKKWSLICIGIMALGLLVKPYFEKDPFLVDIVQNNNPESTSIVTPKITIHIAGAVDHPGVYEVPAHWTTLDLLTHIKVQPNANLDKLKLATPLKPNTRITVSKHKPHKNKKRVRQSQKNQIPPQITQKININTASEKKLETIPGVGPVTAQRIIKFRQKSGRFNTLKDILQIKGIGPKTLKKIERFIRF